MPDLSTCRHCGQPIERCTHDGDYSGWCKGWRHTGYDTQPVIGHCCGGRPINPVAEPREDYTMFKRLFHRCDHEAVAVNSPGGLLGTPVGVTNILWRCSCRDVKSTTLAGRWTLAQVRGETPAPARPAQAPLAVAQAGGSHPDGD